MHGELAQMICLIGHGSAWLAGEPVGVEGLEERNTTFRYGRTVSFSFAAPRGEPVAASTVAAWLSQLAERGIERLWLATDLPGRRSWGLLATGGCRQERWQRTSTVIDPDAPDSRRSRLDYTGVPTRKIAIATPPIAAAQEELLAALAEARAFAAEYELTFWAGWFAAAEALATVEAPLARFHPDMLPEHAYSPDARRLLAIATGAWVFGGIGSWGDLPTAADDERYDPVSDRLYKAMWRGFVASVNSSPNPTADPQ